MTTAFVDILIVSGWTLSGLAIAAAIWALTLLRRERELTDHYKRELLWRNRS